MWLPKLTATALLQAGALGEPAQADGVEAALFVARSPRYAVARRWRSLRSLRNRSTRFQLRPVWSTNPFR
jgi:hypothetical protein